jgi:hypothetical protein
MQAIQEHLQKARHLIDKSGVGTAVCDILSPLRGGLVLDDRRHIGVFRSRYGRSGVKSGQFSPLFMIRTQFGPEIAHALRPKAVLRL